MNTDELPFFKSNEDSIQQSGFYVLTSTTTKWLKSILSGIIAVGLKAQSLERHDVCTYSPGGTMSYCIGSDETKTTGALSVFKCIS